MPSDLQVPIQPQLGLGYGGRLADSKHVPGWIGDSEDLEPDLVAVTEAFERIGAELLLLKTRNRPNLESGIENEGRGMKRDDSSPQAYRENVTGEQHEMLEAIRGVIFEVAAETDEIIEYKMLGYPGLANLAAQKHHVALYVMPAVLAKHRGNFPGVDCGKSCLRFRRLEQIDPGCLRDLLRDVLEARSE